MSSTRKQTKKYLYTKVNPIIELLTASLMKNQPKNTIDFMV